VRRIAACRRPIEYVHNHMLAQPGIMDRGVRGDGQHRVRVVCVQRRHVAWQLGIACQCHVVRELHRDAIAVSRYPVGHARWRVEYDAPEVGMVARTDRHRNLVVCEGGKYRR
jgi:hypothetical protein